MPWGVGGQEVRRATNGGYLDVRAPSTTKMPPPSLVSLETFSKYGREPHLDLSTCSQYIRLRLTVQKKATNAISYNWINVLYKLDGVGQVAVNADNLWQPVERDARQIAEQFCKAHRDMIHLRFKQLLPV